MALTLVLAVSCVCIVMYSLYKQLKIKHKFEACLKEIPGPPPLPILGNVLEFSSSKDILEVLSKFQFKYGPTYKLSAGFTNFMLVSTEQKFLKFLLGSKTILDKSSDYEFLHKWLGTGLLTGAGTKWKLHRQIITPAFHYTHLERFVKIFNEESIVLTKKFEDEAEETATDVYPYIKLCTLDIICRATMGLSLQSQEHKNTQYTNSVAELCKILIDRAFSIIEMNDLLYRLTKNYYKEKKAIKIVHDFSNSVIKNKHVGDNESKTLLRLLLQSKIPLSDEEIREEVDTFMFAGHDTAASATSFVLYCLSNHRDIQLKVVDELNTIMGKNTRDITIKDLNEMRYLEMVIKETLRLYPSVPFYSRKIVEDTYYGDLLMPKDLCVTVFAYGVHRDPNIYQEPEKFDPNRFLPENNKNYPALSFLPFSAGLRNCIGQKFAMLEMKCVVASILMKYELCPTIPEHKLELLSETTLKSANGIKLRLKKRKFI